MRRPTLNAVPYGLQKPYGLSKAQEVRILRSPVPAPSPYPILPSRSSGILASSIYGPGEAEGNGEAAGDAVGEAVGDAVGVLVVAGRVEGAGVVVGAVVGTGVVVVVVRAVRSGRGGGSYGPLSAADNTVPTTAVTSKHAGARTSTKGTRTNGRTQPSKTYHNDAANTTTTDTASHHG
jgi:hypothetical protein